MGRPPFLVLVFLAACGGKVAADDFNSPPISTVTPGATSTPASPPPPKHGGSTPGPGVVVPHLEDGQDYVAAWASSSVGVQVDVMVPAKFDPSTGHLLRFGQRDIAATDPGGGNAWHAWGVSTVEKQRLHYAFGKQMKGSLEDLVLSGASFGLKGGGTSTEDEIEASAYCAFGYDDCKISVNVRTKDGVFQYVPAATIKDRMIVADADDGKSKLRGAFTCDESCTVGRYAGFGLVIAWQIEDPSTGKLSYGAAALPFFDPK